MKNIFLTIALLSFFSLGYAQEKQQEQKIKILYTVAYNKTQGYAGIPLIGFINQHQGTFKSAEVGFINTSIGNLNGAQVGFINTGVGNVKGSQIGFINTISRSAKGAQVGFVNTIAGDIKGAQIGFVNTANKNIKGGQVGFINLARKKVTGVQIGFINCAEEIDGVPIGFLSFVKKGGYKAIEVSTSEIFPLNIAFKTGVRKFYTSIKGGYNPQGKNHFGLGAGVGTHLNLSKSLYYNPEAETMFTMAENSNEYFVSVINSLRLAIGSNMEVAVGPAITWRRNQYDEWNEEALSWAYNYKINRRNDFVIGLRISTSVTF